MTRFDLTGGHPALDFANTLSGRRSPPSRDDLPTYASLLEWSLAAGTLDAPRAVELAAAAAADPAAAAAAHAEAIALREGIFAVFAAVAAGGAPPAAAMAALNRGLARALPHLRLEPAGDGFAWSWEGSDLERPAWPLARAAAELLAGADRDRVRECDADTCAWLFLDRSRNRSRRWCDMQVCGNRAKVRRHRRRAAGSPG